MTNLSDRIRNQLITARNQKVYIFSHKEDLDGILSAALMLSILNRSGVAGENIQTILVNYNEYSNQLESLYPKLNNNNIIITDLGINTEIWEHLMRLPKINSQSPLFRIYIDHHEIPKSFSSKINEILARFSVLINPHLTRDSEAPEISDRFCTAELIYQTCTNLIEDPANKYQWLVQLAHLLDFQNEESEESNIRDLVKHVINFFQNKSQQLHALIQIFNEEKTPHEVLSHLDTYKSEIDAWIEATHQEILQNLIKYEDSNFSLLFSQAQVRPGEITQFLQERFPDQDLYLGYSAKEDYFNIRTPLGIADKIANFFQGGGHKDRAGFRLPSEHSFFQGAVQKFLQKVSKCAQEEIDNGR